MKAAVKLYGNKDPAIQVVREFEEQAELAGHQSLVKDAKRYVWNVIAAKSQLRCIVGLEYV